MQAIPAAAEATRAVDPTVWWEFLRPFFVTQLGAILAFILAAVIILRMLSERRNPGNFFAWALFVLFVPALGIPLYLLFGGRKSRRLAEHKRSVRQLALSIARRERGARPASEKEPLMHSREEDEVPRRFTGNRFQLLGDDRACYEALLEEIGRAEKTIHVCTYILGHDDDEPARAIMQALTARAEDGLEVLLLIDAYGSFRAGRRMLRDFRAAGGRSARFLPILPLQTKASANLRNHRKAIIFDRCRVVTGGQNIECRFIGREHNPRRYRDFSVLIEGPAVAPFTRSFVSDWCYAAREEPEAFQEALGHVPEPAGEEDMEVITSGPDVIGDPLWEEAVSIIQEIRESLLIVTPYFVPDEVVFRSLLVKARTGRKIRLVIPARSDTRVVDFARGPFLRDLHQAGVEIFLYRPSMLHAKLLVADGKVAAVGSANLDMRSMFVNFENAVFLHTEGPIRELLSWTDGILEECIPFARTRQAKVGNTRNYFEEIAHLLAPML